MSGTTPLPADWAKTQTVPTATVEIRGQGGDVVARVTVVGTATVTCTYPYSYRTS